VRDSRGKTGSARERGDAADLADRIAFSSPVGRGRALEGALTRTRRRQRSRLMTAARLNRMLHVDEFWRQHGVGTRLSQCLPPEVRGEGFKGSSAWTERPAASEEFACTGFDPEGRRKVPLDACADAGRLRLAHIRRTISPIAALETPGKKSPKIKTAAGLVSPRVICKMARGAYRQLSLQPTAGARFGASLKAPATRCANNCLE